MYPSSSFPLKVLLKQVIKTLIARNADCMPGSWHVLSTIKLLSSGHPLSGHSVLRSLCSKIMCYYSYGIEYPFEWPLLFMAILQSNFTWPLKSFTVIVSLLKCHVTLETIHWYHSGLTWQVVRKLGGRKIQVPL